jgi:hypothetical protein
MLKPIKNQAKIKKPRPISQSINRVLFIIALSLSRRLLILEPKISKKNIIPIKYNKLTKLSGWKKSESLSI